MNISNESDRKELLNFYITEVKDNFWPYWKNYIDEEYGGVFTCISNDGKELINEDKYLWSQGRYLWLLCRLYLLSDKINLDIDRKKLKSDCYKTVKFIVDNAVLDDFKIVFLTDRFGNHKTIENCDRLDASIYADCFVILGLTGFIKTFKGNNKLTKLLINIYDSVIQRIQNYDFLSEPYPVPDGYRTHAVPMILINIELELIEAFSARERELNEKLQSNIELHVNEIMNIFYNNDNTISEFIKGNGDRDYSMLGNHRNPGHTLECMWFILQYCSLFKKSELIDKINSVIKKNLDIGWDKKFGGLLRFTDAGGNKPDGEFHGSRYEQLILDTWDMKLWWPHSEALYALLYAYKFKKDDELSYWFDRMFEYTFDIFPKNSDKEWIQIRKRNGETNDMVVALPVKDPFHIIRFFILSIELLLKTEE
ncbi:MAG TPA: AGE family epimerase/isomerase [Victivallales bacterium]|nr:AGE family epimerase/isomerase [Victivallales bacterium]